MVTTGKDDEPGINGAIMPNDFDVSVMNTIMWIITMNLQKR